MADTARSRLKDKIKRWEDLSGETVTVDAEDLAEVLAELEDDAQREDLWAKRARRYRGNEVRARSQLNIARNALERCSDTNPEHGDASDRAGIAKAALEATATPTDDLVRLVAGLERVGACPECLGSGEQTAPDHDGVGIPEPCDACGGAGCEAFRRGEEFALDAFARNLGIDRALVGRIARGELPTTKGPSVVLVKAGEPMPTLDEPFAVEAIRRGVRFLQAHDTLRGRPTKHEQAVSTALEFASECYDALMEGDPDALHDVGLKDLRGAVALLRDLGDMPAASTDDEGDEKT